MSEKSQKFVLSLKNVVFKGISGKVGPISLEISSGTDHLLTLNYREDGLKLIRIIKGIAVPLSGKVIKDSRDMMGWIVKDECIALVEEESFFSMTVRDEIAFAAMAGEAKRKLPMTPFLGAVLGTSGLDSQLDCPIEQLNGFQKRVLSLTSSLLMLPNLLIFLDPFAGLDERQRVIYLDLLNLGKKNIGLATLQIAIIKDMLIFDDTINGTRIGESIPVTDGAKGL